MCPYKENKREYERLKEMEIKIRDNLLKKICDGKEITKDSLDDWLPKDRHKRSKKIRKKNRTVLLGLWSLLKRVFKNREENFQNSKLYIRIGRVTWDQILRQEDDDTCYSRLICLGTFGKAYILNRYPCEKGHGSIINDRMEKLFQYFYQTDFYALLEKEKLEKEKTAYVLDLPKIDKTNFKQEIIGCRRKIKKASDFLDGYEMNEDLKNFFNS